MCSVVPTEIVKSGDADGKLVVQFTPTDAKSSAGAGSIACDTVLFAIGTLGAEVEGSVICSGVGRAFLI